MKTFLHLSCFLFIFSQLHADATLDRAKKTYQKSLQDAEKKLLKAYEVSLKKAMKKGDIDAANSLNDEIEHFKNHGSFEVFAAEESERLSKEAATKKKPSYIPDEAKYFNNNWYLFINEASSLTQAKERARAMKAKVLVISNEQENKFIQENMGFWSAWLGMEHEKVKVNNRKDAREKRRNDRNRNGEYADERWLISGKFKAPYTKWGDRAALSAYSINYAVITRTEGLWKVIHGEKYSKNCIILEWGREQKAPKN